MLFELSCQLSGVFQDGFDSAHDGIPPRQGSDAASRLAASRDIVMLVSDGSVNGTKATDAAELGTRVVHPEPVLGCAEPPATGQTTPTVSES